ncbi:hypothetical protein LTR37_017083 [Vermiconidia calcicola]|uniref:Uncharacterized protein n=1 Tax=Vermiconidia calcicola TaxID=1690605 RepID=A0ACC3MMJ1_9PEZI|nr:hypothetical protein LTR37_017083 [Vermiconidia calcicola]
MMQQSGNRVQIQARMKRLEQAYNRRTRNSPTRPQPDRRAAETPFEDSDGDDTLTPQDQRCGTTEEDGEGGEGGGRKGEEGTTAESQTSAQPEEQDRTNENVACGCEDREDMKAALNEVLETYAAGMVGGLQQLPRALERYEEVNDLRHGIIDRYAIETLSKVSAIESHITNIATAIASQAEDRDIILQAVGRGIAAQWRSDALRVTRSDGSKMKTPAAHESSPASMGEEVELQVKEVEVEGEGEEEEEVVAADDAEPKEQAHHSLEMPATGNFSIDFELQGEEKAGRTDSQIEWRTVALLEKEATTDDIDGGKQKKLEGRDGEESGRRVLGEAERRGEEDYGREHFQAEDGELEDRAFGDHKHKAINGYAVDGLDVKHPAAEDFNVNVHETYNVVLEEGTAEDFALEASTSELSHVEDSAAEEINIDDSAAEAFYIEGSTADEMDDKKSAVDEPLMEDFAVEYPVTEDAAVEYNAIIYPAVEYPAIDGPVAEDDLIGEEAVGGRIVDGAQESSSTAKGLSKIPASDFFDFERRNGGGDSGREEDGREEGDDVDDRLARMDEATTRNLGF